MKTNLPCIDLALDILKRYPTMAHERDENNNGKTALHVLAQKATHITSNNWLKIVAKYISGKTPLHVLPQKATNITSNNWLKIVARYTTSLCKFF
jgi:hypothetical protein